MSGRQTTAESSPRNNYVWGEGIMNNYPGKHGVYIICQFCSSSLYWLDDLSHQLRESPLVDLYSILDRQWSLLLRRLMAV